MGMTPPTTSPRWEISDEELKAEFDAADLRGAADPLVAVKARYKARGRSLEVTLRNGIVLSVPVDLIVSLKGAKDADLAKVRIVPAGWALEWPTLDADFTIAAMVQHTMGEEALLRASAAIAGSVKSPAKAVAASRNGLKGGRPKKAARRAAPSGKAGKGTR